MATIFHEEVWASKGSLTACGHKYYEMGRRARGSMPKIVSGVHSKDLAWRTQLNLTWPLILETAAEIAPELLKKGR